MSKLAPGGSPVYPKRSFFKRRENHAICFKHRVSCKLCHCQSPNRLVVSSRIRIPAKDDEKGWKALFNYYYPGVEWRWDWQDIGLRGLPKPGERRAGRYVPVNLPTYPRLSKKKPR